MIKRLILFLCLCGHPFAKAQVLSFPYPEIPSSITTNEERLTWFITKYWSNFNFSDTLLIEHPDVTEQGFANYLDLLPKTDSLNRIASINAFMQNLYHSETPEKVRSYFEELSEHYLYNPNSPLRNEQLYLLFLKTTLSRPEIDNALRQRYAFRLENVGKNMPGSPATDFIYEDRAGRKTSLYQTKGEFILIYFNDPDCENCHAITDIMRRDSLLTNNPRLTVLAVYPDANTQAWRTHTPSLPSSWLDVCSPEGEITERLLYFIQATPTLYLLDKDKKVILKDPMPGEVVKWLEMN